MYSEILLKEITTMTWAWDTDQVRESSKWSPRTTASARIKLLHHAESNPREECWISSPTSGGQKNLGVRETKTSLIHI